MKKVLVLSVGGSPTPLIISIENYKPDIVYFIHSKETLKSANKVIATINSENIEYYFEEIANPESLKESFDKGNEVLFKLRSNEYSVHIDFTGGTKPMVAGLVLSSINKECEYSYVGAKSIDGRDKDGVGIVKDGFESIKMQENPYELYAIKEFENGETFFNLYQFKAALQNFGEAKNKSNQKNLIKLATFYIKLVRLYSAWDKFSKKVDNIHIPKYFRNEILKDIELLDKESEFYKQVMNNYEFLNLKISHKNRNIQENIKYHLPDLLNNAERRIEEQKFDDAIARLYRAVELIAQIQLHELGLINFERLKVNEEFFIDKNKLHEIASFNVLEKVETWYEYNNKYSTMKLASNRSYELLSLLDIEYAKEYLNDSKIEKTIKLRNKSILAHGLNAMDYEKAKKLYDDVLEYAKELNPEIEKYMEMAKFPKFKGA